MDIVTTNLFTEAFVAAVTPWLMGALGIGVAMLAIYSGWSVLQDLAHGGNSDQPNDQEPSESGCDDDDGDVDEEMEDEE